MSSLEQSININPNEGSKRAQVKRACDNCRKTHRSCGEERPCKRCKEKGWPCSDDLKRGEPKQKKPKPTEVEQSQDDWILSSESAIDISPFDSTPLDPLVLPELSLDLADSLTYIPEISTTENLSSQIKELNHNICQLTSLLKSRNCDSSPQTKLTNQLTCLT